MTTSMCRVQVERHGAARQWRPELLSLDTRTPRGNSPAAMRARRRKRATPVPVPVPVVQMLVMLFMLLAGAQARHINAVAPPVEGQVVRDIAKSWSDMMDRYKRNNNVMLFPDDLILVMQRQGEDSIVEGLNSHTLPPEQEESPPMVHLDGMDVLHFLEYELQQDVIDPRDVIPDVGHQPQDVGPVAMSLLRSKRHAVHERVKRNFAEGSVPEDLTSGIAPQDLDVFEALNKNEFQAVDPSLFAGDSSYSHQSFDSKDEDAEKDVAQDKAVHNHFVPVVQFVPMSESDYPLQKDNGPLFLDLFKIKAPVEDVVSDGTSLQTTEKSTSAAEAETGTSPSETGIPHLTKSTAVVETDEYERRGKGTNSHSDATKQANQRNQSSTRQSDESSEKLNHEKPNSYANLHETNSEVVSTEDDAISAVDEPPIVFNASQFVQDLAFGDVKNETARIPLSVLVKVDDGLPPVESNISSMSLGISLNESAPNQTELSRNNKLQKILPPQSPPFSPDLPSHSKYNSKEDATPMSLEAQHLDHVGSKPISHDHVALVNSSENPTLKMPNTTDTSLENSSTGSDTPHILQHNSDSDIVAELVTKHTPLERPMKDINSEILTEYHALHPNDDQQVEHLRRQSTPRSAQYHSGNPINEEAELKPHIDGRSTSDSAWNTEMFRLQTNEGAKKAPPYLLIGPPPSHFSQNAPSFTGDSSGTLQTAHQFPTQTTTPQEIGSVPLEHGGIQLWNGAHETLAAQEEFPEPPKLREVVAVGAEGAQSGVDQLYFPSSKVNGHQSPGINIKPRKSQQSSHIISGGEHRFTSYKGISEANYPTTSSGRNEGFPYDRSIPISATSAYIDHSKEKSANQQTDEKAILLGDVVSTSTPPANLSQAMGEIMNTHDSVNGESTAISTDSPQRKKKKKKRKTWKLPFIPQTTTPAPWPRSLASLAPFMPDPGDFGPPPTPAPPRPPHRRPKFALPPLPSLWDPSTISQTTYSIRQQPVQQLAYMEPYPWDMYRMDPYAMGYWTNNHVDAAFPPPQMSPMSQMQMMWPGGEYYGMRRRRSVATDADGSQTSRLLQTEKQLTSPPQPNLHVESAAIGNTKADEVFHFVSEKPNGDASTPIPLRSTEFRSELNSTRLNSTTPQPAKLESQVSWNPKIRRLEQQDEDREEKVQANESELLQKSLKPYPWEGLPRQSSFLSRIFPSFRHDLERHEDVLHSVPERSNFSEEDLRKYPLPSSLGHKENSPTKLYRVLLESSHRSNNPGRNHSEISNKEEQEDPTSVHQLPSQKEEVDQRPKNVSRPTLHGSKIPDSFDELIQLPLTAEDDTLKNHDMFNNRSHEQHFNVQPIEIASAHILSPALHKSEAVDMSSNASEQKSRSSWDSLDLLSTFEKEHPEQTQKVLVLPLTGKETIIPARENLDQEENSADVLSTGDSQLISEHHDMKPLQVKNNSPMLDYNSAQHKNVSSREHLEMPLIPTIDKAEQQLASSSKHTLEDSETSKQEDLLGNNDATSILQTQPILHSAEKHRLSFANEQEVGDKQEEPPLHTVLSGMAEHGSYGYPVLPASNVYEQPNSEKLLEKRHSELVKGKYDHPELLDPQLPFSRAIVMTEAPMQKPHTQLTLVSSSLSTQAPGERERPEYLNSEDVLSRVQNQDGSNKDFADTPIPQSQLKEDSPYNISPRVMKNEESLNVGSHQSLDKSLLSLVNTLSQQNQHFPLQELLLSEPPLAYRSEQTSEVPFLSTGLPLEGLNLKSSKMMQDKIPQPDEYGSLKRSQGSTIVTSEPDREREDSPKFIANASPPPQFFTLPFITTEPQGSNKPQNHNSTLQKTIFSGQNETELEMPIIDLTRHHQRSTENIQQRDFDSSPAANSATTPDRDTLSLVPAKLETSTSFQLLVGDESLVTHSSENRPKNYERDYGLQLPKEILTATHSPFNIAERSSEMNREDEPSYKPHFYVEETTHGSQGNTHGSAGLLELHRRLSEQAVQVSQPSTQSYALQRDSTPSDDDGEKTLMRSNEEPSESVKKLVSEETDSPKNGDIAEAKNQKLPSDAFDRDHDSPPLQEVPSILPMRLQDELSPIHVEDSLDTAFPRLDRSCTDSTNNLCNVQINPAQGPVQVAVSAEEQPCSPLQTHPHHHPHHPHHAPPHPPALPPALEELLPGAKETEEERAEREQKAVQRMIQVVNVLGSLQSFVSDRAKTIVKRLHRIVEDEDSECQRLNGM